MKGRDENGRIGLIGANQSEPVAHALGNAVLDFLFGFWWLAIKHLVHDPYGSGFTVWRLAPALMEHHLVEPLIGIIFKNERNRCTSRIIRYRLWLGGEFVQTWPACWSNPDWPRPQH